MMHTDGGWIEKFGSKFLSLFSRREVKTPLSFFFRVVAAVTVMVLVTVFLIVPELRFQVFLVGVGVCVFLFSGVFVFAWRNPKNLVYGETGHRAEMQLRLGTESTEISGSQLAALEGTANPKMLPPEGS